MSNHITDFPKGWDDDLLSHFQTIAFKNELATFAHATEWQNLLRDVATVMNKCSSYVIQLVYKTNEPSAILLFLTSHNQYLASARSISAGQCLAVFPTGRATVEFALYSWYLSNNEEAALRWYEKPKDKDELKKWSKEFTFSSIVKLLNDRDQGLANWAKHLYQFAIDFGAHPNKDALYSNIEQTKGDDGSITFKMVYLHPWNQLSISTTKFAIETGMIAIQLFAHSFPDIQKELNLSQDIGRLVNDLSHLVATTKL